MKKNKQGIGKLNVKLQQCERFHIRMPHDQQYQSFEMLWKKLFKMLQKLEKDIWNLN
jgi:hypothetical protein